MGYESREDSQQMDWRNYPQHRRDGTMSAPGNVTSYAPKPKGGLAMNNPTNGDATDNNFEAPQAPQLPSEPAVLSSTIEGAIGRIGDIAAQEMERTADEIMDAAEHVAGQFRRLAAAMRKTVDGHGKAAADFCARMQNSYEAVRTLSVAFEHPKAASEGHEGERHAEADTEVDKKPVPKFLLKGQK